MDLKTLNYNLWFYARDGGIHELVRETQRKTLTNYGTNATTPFDGKRMAEKALTMMDYADRALMHAGYQSKRERVDVRRTHDEQIRRVHHACQDDIESRWNTPVMSNEQFEQALFEDAIAEELERIQKAYEVEIKL